MARSADQIKVAQDGDIYVAAYGATLPTDVASPLDAAFGDGVGYASEDGVTFNKSEETEQVRVWQRQNAVKIIVTSRDFAASVQLAQWNPDNFGYAFGGGEWTEPEPGVYRYDPPADHDPLADYSVVIEAKNGDYTDRYVIEKCNITGEIETQLQRSAPSLLPITFSALTPDDAERPWHFLTDDPEFDPAAS